MTHFPINSNLHQLHNTQPGLFLEADPNFMASEEEQERGYNESAGSGQF